MKRLTMSLLMLLAIAASGCATDPRDINREPALTAVGSGLLADRVPVPSEPTPPPTYKPGNSIWQDGSADLFRDPQGAQDRRRRHGQDLDRATRPSSTTTRNGRVTRNHLSSPN